VSVESVRAFFAVELDESARAAAKATAAELGRRDEAGVLRLMRLESLHVTLRFLGDVATDRLGGLVECVTKQAAEVAPFEVGLGELMVFPSARRPRVLAAGVEPAGPLAQAAAAVERGCVAAGFEPETRPYRGHLTLGRMKRGPAPRFDDVVVPDHEPTAVRDAVLFRSELGRDGARYTPLERIPFCAAEGGNDSEPRL